MSRRPRPARARDLSPIRSDLQLAGPADRSNAMVRRDPVGPRDAVHANPRLECRPCLVASGIQVLDGTDANQQAEVGGDPYVRFTELNVLLYPPSDACWVLQQNDHELPPLNQSVKKVPVSPFRTLNELALSFQPIVSSVP